MEPLPRPVLWLMAANLLIVAAAAVAYLTAISFVLLATVAVVPAIAGLHDIRQQLARKQSLTWVDRAFSTAIGTAVLAAMLVAIPYVITQDGVSLWTTRGYAVAGLMAVGMGWGLWNACALQGLSDWADIRRVPRFAMVHAALILAAVVVLLAGADDATASFSFRGDTYARLDLALSPALLGITGLTWSLGLSRCRDLY